MKLLDAPVIPQRFAVGKAGNGWIEKAGARARELFANPPTENRQGKDQRDYPLKQLAEDIWAIKGPLGLHTDKTRKGFRVIGLVLINEPGLVLVQDEDCYRLPAGTIYHIDGRAPHGAVIPSPDLCGNRNGLFAFMAWDVHRDEDLKELIDSIPDAMLAFANNEPRIDVSTTAKPIK